MIEKINKIIKEAKDLGLKDKLIEREEDFKIIDPSLQELERYELALEACKEISDGYSKGLRFDRSDMNVVLPPTHTKTTNRMITLSNELTHRQEIGEKLNLKTYSQIGQDIFINNLLQEKKDGLFFDIGAGPPIFINNTYLFETEYNWTGISIDASELNRIQWKMSHRKSKFLCEDALALDYDKIITDLLKQNNKNRIDYLSIDLEPPSLTIEVLFKLITNTKHRFSTITFEHDCWRESTHILKTSRQLLMRYGYLLIGDNINNQEDWWVDGSY